jgi:predicted GNAT family N-acyltransferase
MHVRLADYVADQAAIRRIRFAVFVDEQHVPADLEMDDRDRHCVHVIAHDDAGRAVGTGRIDVEAGGKIGRVAVLGDARGTGVGTALMQELHAIAKRASLASVWCNAQQSAAAFYTRLGYRVTSEPFFEAGIEHVRMCSEL